MKVKNGSQLKEEEIRQFLENSKIPMRLAFNKEAQQPQICSLWYIYAEGALWAATHRNSFLLEQIKNDPLVSFEISTNDYPYKGVRGSGIAERYKQQAEHVLSSLIDKYLDDNNKELADWLMSRVQDEYAIRIKPDKISGWDFSFRMQRQSNDKEL